MKELKILKKPLFWLISGLVLVGAAIFQLPKDRLHLVFCDVGQGDATLIIYRSTQVLVDGGPNDQVLQCLSENLPFWDRKIELVVLTHPQADHFTGLIEVVGRYEVGQFMINSVVNDSKGFWKFYQAVLEEGAPVYSPQAGDKIRLGPMELLVLWPKEKFGDERVWRRDSPLGAYRNYGSASDSLAKQSRLSDESHRRSQGEASQNLAGTQGREDNILGAATYDGDLNETSIVLQLSFDDFDALLTGDIGFDIEKKIDWPVNRQIEVLKIPHHGSKYSTGKEFLEEVQPHLAVISVGAKNRFGHPTEEVIEKLSNLEIKISRTDQEGEIEIVSDGREWEF